MSNVSCHGIEHLGSSVAEMCYPCPRTVLLPLSPDHTHRIANSRVQLRRGDAYEPADHVQPDRMVVVFQAPVHRIAGKSVPGGQSDDTSILHMTESALHGDPQRTVPVESEVVDTAFGQTVGGHVRCADLTVLDVRHAALKPKPQAALPRGRKQRRNGGFQPWGC